LEQSANKVIKFCLLCMAINVIVLLLSFFVNPSIVTYTSLIVLVTGYFLPPFIILYVCMHSKEIFPGRDTVLPTNAVMSILLPVVLFFQMGFQFFGMTCIVEMKVRQNVKQIFSQMNEKDVIVKIDGKEVNQPAIWFNAIRSFDKITPHHSHSEEKAKFEIISVGQKLTLLIGRDSYVKNEYWVYYPDFIPRQHIGSFYTDTLNITTKLINEYESYQNVESVINTLKAQGYSGVWNAYNYRPNRVSLSSARFDILTTDNFKHLGFRGEICYIFFNKQLANIKFTVSENDLEKYLKTLNNNLGIDLLGKKIVYLLNTRIKRDEAIFVWEDMTLFGDMCAYKKYTEGKYDHDPPIEFHP